MWRHGIHSFLELLIYPLDYILAFIYLAYFMMDLLYETVPAFEDTWIECLGDLRRHLRPSRPIVSEIENFDWNCKTFVLESFR
jgi:hypothetical protein